MVCLSKRVFVDASVKFMMCLTPIQNGTKDLKATCHTHHIIDVKLDMCFVKDPGFYSDKLVYYFGHRELMDSNSLTKKRNLVKTRCRPFRERRWI